jgi:hypothetical protein
LRITVFILLYCAVHTYTLRAALDLTDSKSPAEVTQVLSGWITLWVNVSA